MKIGRKCQKSLWNRHRRCYGTLDTEVAEWRWEISKYISSRKESETRQISRHYTNSLKWRPRHTSAVWRRGVLRMSSPQLRTWSIRTWKIWSHSNRQNQHISSKQNTWPKSSLSAPCIACLTGRRISSSVHCNTRRGISNRTRRKRSKSPLTWWTWTL